MRWDAQASLVPGEARTSQIGAGYGCRLRVVGTGVGDFSFSILATRGSYHRDGAYWLSRNVVDEGDHAQAYVQFVKEYPVSQRTAWLLSVCSAVGAGHCSTPILGVLLRSA
jgi:hypothetical protein